MSNTDYEGVYKYKVGIFVVIISIIVSCLVGHLFFYHHYLQIFLFFQGISLLKLGYYSLMAIVVMRRTMRVLERVENKKQQQLKTEMKLYHLIVLPIYQEPVSIIKNALNYLASHEKAKQTYLIFLAIEQRSPNAHNNAEQLKKMFQSSFRLFEYTIHTLIKGEPPGKASNEQYCLTQLQGILIKEKINLQEVMFSSIDSDNLMPQAYFEEMEAFLGNNDWNIHRFMFGANQMYSINSADVPMVNRATDFMLGSIIFMWSGNLTHTQAVMSNYSLSYKSFKEMGFFDMHPDSTGDDLYVSAKVLWKSQGKMEMIHIPIHTNMFSLKTGEGYIADMYARFWQAERHMRAFYVTTYNLNYFFRAPFRLKTFLSLIFYLQFEFLNVGSIIAVIIHVLVKMMTATQTTIWEQFVYVGQFSLMVLIHTLYFLCIRRTAKVMYKDEERVSIWRLIESVCLHYVIISFYFILPKMVAAFKAPFTESRFNTAPKICANKYIPPKLIASKEIKSKPL